MELEYLLPCLQEGRWSHTLGHINPSFYSQASLHIFWLKFHMHFPTLICLLENMWIINLEHVTITEIIKWQHSIGLNVIEISWEVV
jgi:hypothetical protein